MADKEGDGQQAAASDTAAPVVEGDDTSTTDPKVEARARDMGWRPKEEFKGEPDKWRSADEFVKRGEEILPIVNAENKRLKAEIEKVRRESSETIARTERVSRLALSMQREQLVQRYEVLKERAVEQGDTKGYRAAEAAKTDALTKFDAKAEEARPPEPKKAVEQPGEAMSPRDQEIMNEWMAENTWYSAMRADKVPKNPVLFAAANEEWDRLEEEEPGLPVAKKLAKITAAVQRDFPARFGLKANGTRSPMVEGGNGRGPEAGDGDRGKQWAKVPQEVRGVARNQIEEEGLFHHIVGAKAGTKLTPAQLSAAREAWAERYFMP